MMPSNWHARIGAFGTAEVTMEDWPMTWVYDHRFETSARSAGTDALGATSLPMGWRVQVVKSHDGFGWVLAYTRENATPSDASILLGRHRFDSGGIGWCAEIRGKLMKHPDHEYAIHMIDTYPMRALERALRQWFNALAPMLEPVKQCAASVERIPPDMEIKS